MLNVDILFNSRNSLIIPKSLLAALTSMLLLILFFTIILKHFRYENEGESYEHSLAYHAMVAVDKSLYVIGGYTTVKYLNSAKRFEPLTKTWSEVSFNSTSVWHVQI